MKAKLPSRTAEHNALFRAIEYARRPGGRIVSDGIAQSFLSAPFKLLAMLARNSACATILCRYIDYRWPGSRTSLIARTRLIDDYVSSAIANGIPQIVLLGAGFDSRAYRIAGAERTRFFEVDHPNTSAVKMAHIARALGALPEHVKFVPIDFQRDGVRESLEAAGFNPLQRSLFVWEGVSNYLTEDAVRSTLTFIGSVAQGTALAFTYVDESVLHHPAHFAGGSEVQKAFARLEEPWIFGIWPDRASEFFQDCGLDLDYDLSAAEYRKQYYQTADRIRGYEFYHVVLAHIPKRGAYFRANLAREALFA
ncbi:MAG TPA: SAM-dependent methyltransferase [Acidobacteriaceae bacterium]|jgi:methyltransferase (TIGR00027 family)|nr:SAM-dependent methyltransferase [Acidobacteriaceae bacterium]